MHNKIYLGAHAYAPRNQGYLTVATTDPTKFLNIIFDSTRGYNQVTLSPMQARQLRDELLKAYPVSGLDRDTGMRLARGNHIVALVEDGKFKPNAEPFIHPDLASASREAQRLAKLHGKDFAVLRPMVAANANVKVVKTVEVEVVSSI